MSGVTWLRSGTAAPPSPWAPLLGWADLLGAVLCPPALLVALPLAVVWKPAQRALWRLVTLLLVAGTAVGWWYWATGWQGGQGGLATVLRSWLDAYLTVLLDARDSMLATRTLPDRRVWLEAVLATWRVWLPVGVLLGGLHALLGTADDDGTSGGVRPRSPGGALRGPGLHGASGDLSQGNGMPGGSPGGSRPGARFPGDMAPPGAGGPQDDDGAATVEPAVTQREPAPRRWLLPDLVPYGPLPRWRFGWRWPFAWREVRGYVTAMVGMAGTKKSYLLLDFGTAAVTGGEWAGHPVRRIRQVLYVDCELDPETFWRRAFEVARGRGLSRPPRGLHYLNLTGVSLASPEGWDRVWVARRRCTAEAILVDSVTIGAFTVSTNDAGAMNRLFGGFEAWGVPVFAIDHLGKDPGKGAVGTFMKYAKIRSELTLRAVRGLIQVTHSKTNFGRQLDPFSLEPRFDQRPQGQGQLAVSFVPAGSAGHAGAGASVLPAAPTPAPLRTFEPPVGAPTPVAPAVTPVAPVHPVDAGAGLVGEAKWDAQVLAAYRQQSGVCIPREDVAAALHCSVKRVANSLSNLRRAGLVENVGPGLWRVPEPTTVPAAFYEATDAGEASP